MDIKFTTKANEMKLYQFLKEYLPENYCIFKPQYNYRCIIDKNKNKKEIERHERNWPFKSVEFVHEYGYAECSIDIDGDTYRIKCGRTFFETVLKGLLQNFESIQEREDTRKIIVKVYNDSEFGYKLYLTSFDLNRNDPYE
jgi:hypothetical protein